MTGGPVVLLGQGEQYDDPDDWRELVRARRIRRGVELAVRRDGLTTLRRPEDVPELAAVLDAVDPPLAPGVAAAPTGPPPSIPATPAGVATPAAAAPGAGAPPPPPPHPPRSGPPTARPRGWRLPIWPLLIGVGVLLLLRLCARDGFGPLPGFGDRADRAAIDARRPDGSASRDCAHPRGWLARATCDDAELARLRPALLRAYTARAAGLDAHARAALDGEQMRWQASRDACRHAADPGACLEPRYRRRIAELNRGG